MHISRSDDLLSRLSLQERRFAKRYLLTALVRLRQLPHSFMLAVLPYENNRGSDGDGFLVSALSEVAWRSWRSIWSSCCRSSCAAMVRLPGSRCPALRMTWVYSIHFISQISPNYRVPCSFLLLLLYHSCRVLVVRSFSQGCVWSVENFAVSISSGQPGMYPWGL